MDPACTADYVVSSYISTLSSLHKARSEWKSVPRTELAGLLVCEASSGEGPARHLPNAANEVHIVRDCFESAQAHVLNEPSAHTSLSRLRTLLKGTPAHILHLACHGIQDSNPLKSAILLQDGRLTIEDIMQLHLPHAVLAFLSACQTAKGDRNAPDQAVHLAASMLFCGFRSVIGTMWCAGRTAPGSTDRTLTLFVHRLMHDEDGPKVARRVYEALFERDSLDLDDIPYALDEAVQALRHAGVPASRWALFMHMGG
jgi:CHAT domain-containing protein